MFSYVPERLASPAALVVVLHGCKQRAADFARDAGWLAFADDAKVALLLPEQRGLPWFFHDVFVPPVVVASWGANNQNGCFNWFQPEDNVARQGRSAFDPSDDRHHDQPSFPRPFARFHRRPFRRWRDGGRDACGLSGPVRRRRHCRRCAVSMRRDRVRGFALHESRRRPFAGGVAAQDRGRRAAFSGRSRSGRAMPTHAWSRPISANSSSNGRLCTASRIVRAAPSRPDRHTHGFYGQCWCCSRRKRSRSRSQTCLPDRNRRHLALRKGWRTS